MKKFFQPLRSCEKIGSIPHKEVGLRSGADLLLVANQACIEGGQAGREAADREVRPTMKFALLEHFFTASQQAVPNHNGQRSRKSAARHPAH
jgi:hypothetical protein